MLTDAEKLRYSRQIRLAKSGEARQEKLKTARAVVLGCGALGSAVAERLVRAGLGHLTLVDRDLVELSNLPRQTLYTEADALKAWPKAEAAARHLRAINSACEFTPRVLHVSPENIESLIADADCVLDGSDNFELRYLLNDAAVKHGTPWVYAGVLGTEALTMAILPGQTPCLRCLFEEAPSVGEAPSCETFGVLGTSVGLIANLQATEALKVLWGEPETLHGKLLSVDPTRGRFTALDVSASRNESCQACARGEFVWLEWRQSPHTALLCGSDSVQITPANGERLDLARFAARWPHDALLKQNPFLLRLKADEQELTLFADGRAILHGIRDANQALAIYERVIGR